MADVLADLRRALSLVIKGCATSPGFCPSCKINRQEATEALEAWGKFDSLYNLAVVCRRCGALADPDNHACEE
jgi:hypothetical protein